MSKHLILLVIFFSIKTYLFAQVPDDALRNAWFIPGGTARSIAIGEAMGSLGGDISANNINPAGIASYKTLEFAITPGIMLNQNKFDYRGTNTSLSKSAFAYGSIGFVSGYSSRKNNNSNAFSVSVTQLASFNNHTYYKGYNNVSSYSEKYLEELVGDGADTIAAASNYIFGSSLAYQTYLIDAIVSNNQLTGYKTLVPVNTGVLQERDENTSGGLHEISLAFAGNFNNKLLVGGSFNIDISSYKRDLWFRESDATSDPNNNFDHFQYNEHYKSSGAGLNIKLGMIYKPGKGTRLGLALHSPSYLGFEDKIRSDMITNTEAYAGLRTESSDRLNNGEAGDATYNMLTPWRAILSGSYVFNAVENTKKQRGFITADIEYVNYAGARFYATNSDDPTGKDYYNSLNDIIKDYYKGAFNFRTGGELKFDPWAIRLGGAYYGSPYSDNVLEANRIMASAGIGYRNRGFFIDLTYSETFNKDVNFPYRLNDKPDTFATWKNNRGNILLTVGVKI